MPLGEAQGYAGLASQPSDRYQGDLADAAAAPLEARTLAESRAGGLWGRAARRRARGEKTMDANASPGDRRRMSARDTARSRVTGSGLALMVRRAVIGALPHWMQKSRRSGVVAAAWRAWACSTANGAAARWREIFLLAVACACGRVEKSGCVLRGRQNLAGPGGGVYCRPSCAAAPRSIEKTLGKHLIHRPSSRHSPPTPYRKPTQSSPPSSIPPPAFPTACTTPSSTVEMANEVSPPPPRPRCPP